MLIVLAFVFWGPAMNFNLSDINGVARVNGEPIPISEFQERFQSLSQRYQHLLSQAKTSAQQEQIQRMLQKNEIDNLITLTLLSQLGKREGVYVSNAEVAEQITQFKAFHKNGKFSRFQYKNYFSKARKTAAEFEESLRKELFIPHWSSIFRAALRSSNLEMDSMKKVAKYSVKGDIFWLNGKNLKNRPKGKKAKEQMGQAMAKLRKALSQKTKELFGSGLKNINPKKNALQSV